MTLSLAQKFPKIYSISLKKEAKIADCWCNINQSGTWGLEEISLIKKWKTWASFMKSGHPKGIGTDLNGRLIPPGNFSTKTAF